MSEVYQDAANVLRLMDRHHLGLRDAFYNRPALKTLQPSVMKQSFALICKASHWSTQLKKILVLSDVVPQLYQWNGTKIGVSVQAAMEKITVAPTSSTIGTVAGWSKKGLKRKHHEMMVSARDQLGDTLDPYLCLVMAYDLLYGSGTIDSGGPEAKLMKSKEATLKECIEANSHDASPNKMRKLDNEGHGGVDSIQSPVRRYLRVNQCRISVHDALAALDGSLKQQQHQPKKRNKGDKALTTVRLSVDPLLQGVIHIHHSESVSHLVQHPLVLNGSVVFQDRASCLSAVVANIQPGMTVLDVCSAPGSKALHVLDLLRGQGCLIAVERDEKRAAILIQRLKLCFELEGPYACTRCLTPGFPVIGETGGRRKPHKAPARTNTKRLQRRQTKVEERRKETDEPKETLFLFPRKKEREDSKSGPKKNLIVVVIIGDVLKLDRQQLTTPTPCPTKECCNRSPSELATVTDIDVVLVDPSCSGSGLLVNPYHSVSPWTPTEKDPKRIHSLAAFQKRILSHALKAFQPNLVCYSTCSVYVEENEAVVDAVVCNRATADDDIRLGYHMEEAMPYWKTSSEATSELKDRYLKRWDQQPGSKPQQQDNDDGDDKNVSPDKKRQMKNERRSSVSQLARQQQPSDCKQRQSSSKLSPVFDLCFHSNPLYDQCRGFFLAKICRKT